MEHEHSFRRAFDCITASSDGKFLYACDNQRNVIYVSTDYRNRYDTTHALTDTRASIAPSSDGKYVYVSREKKISTGKTFPTYLYRSSDNGTTWADVLTSGSRIWYDIVVPSNGRYEYAESVDHIYVSSNYGHDWAPMTMYVGNYSCIATSGSGQYLYAAVSGTIIQAQKIFFYPTSIPTSGVQISQI